MSTVDERWAEVDDYVAQQFGLADRVLEEALQASSAEGLPPIQVSAPQGRLLQIIARSIGARRILEIGTLGGYSTIWLGRALPPDGQLVTLELDPHHAQVARANLERAGLAERVEVMVGEASRSLARLASEAVAPFDMVFVDADKEGYPDYLEWSVRLSHPGTVIVADNVVRAGALLDPDHAHPLVRAVRRFAELLAADERLEATIIQTVGSKGYDGMAVAVVR